MNFTNNHDSSISGEDLCMLAETGIDVWELLSEYVVIRSGKSSGPVRYEADAAAHIQNDVDFVTDAARLFQKPVFPGFLQAIEKLADRQPKSTVGDGVVMDDSDVNALIKHLGDCSDIIIDVCNTLHGELTKTSTSGGFFGFGGKSSSVKSEERRHLLATYMAQGKHIVTSVVAHIINHVGRQVGITVPERQPRFVY